MFIAINGWGITSITSLLSFRKANKNSIEITNEHLLVGYYIHENNSYINHRSNISSQLRRGAKIILHSKFVQMKTIRVEKQIVFRNNKGKSIPKLRHSTHHRYHPRLHHHCSRSSKSIERARDQKLERMKRRNTRFVPKSY